MIQFAERGRADIAQFGEHAGEAIAVTEPAHQRNLINAVLGIAQPHAGFGNPFMRQKILRRHPGLRPEQACKCVLAHAGNFRQHGVGNPLAQIFVNEINRFNYPAVSPGLARIGLRRLASSP